MKSQWSYSLCLKISSIPFYKKLLISTVANSDSIFNRYCEGSVICRLSERNGSLCEAIAEQVHCKVVQQFQYRPLGPGIALTSYNTV